MHRVHLRGLCNMQRVSTDKEHQPHAQKLTQVKQGRSSKAKLGIAIADAGCLKLICRMGRWVEGSAQVYHCPQACALSKKSFSLPLKLRRGDFHRSTSVPKSKAVTVFGVYRKRVAGSILRRAGCLGLTERLVGVGESCMLPGVHTSSQMHSQRQQIQLPSIF